VVRRRRQPRPPRAPETPRSSPIRILLADTQRAFVEALAPRLHAEAGLRVVATATQPEEALRVAATRSVDVALLTVDGGSNDFLAGADALLAARLGLVVVAVAEEDDVPLLARAVRLGFRGWVPKAVDVATLVQAIRGVHRGETHIPPILLTRLFPYLLNEQKDRRAAEQPFASLTVREMEVLRRMSGGATRRDIAADLAVSPNTVRTHVQSILAKLDVHTSLAAVTMARRAGIG
jgi:DNA-binding NarL/FixJ family response regulator